MRACEVVLSVEKAERTRVMIERLTGKACPCDRGARCPLFPVEQEEQLRQNIRQKIA